MFSLVAAATDEQAAGLEHRNDDGMGLETIPSRRKQLPAVLVLALFIACGIVVRGAAARQTHLWEREQRRLLFFKEKQNSSCPNGWQQGPTDARCFLFVNMSSSWEESEASCRNRSGHLASLTSDMELFFIQHRCSTSFSSPCWIGGRESNSGSPWRWSDCHVHWNVSNPLLHPLPFGNCTSSNCLTNAEEHCVLVSNNRGLLLEDCNAVHPFVCVLATEDGKCPQATTRKEYLIILIAVSCLILVTTLAIVIWLLVYRRTKRKRRSRRQANRSSSSMVPLPSLRLFTVEELKIATNNFGLENRLRGSTFKGILSDGVLVAVKKLERPSFQGRKEYMAEMSRIARLRHPNLVTMIGCCYDHGERYIVYEYISNGPLDLWLHDPVRRGALDWRTRMRIAVTAAQGIAYLHDQVKPHVIHRDIKSSSILLDENFNSHLMRVGLANIIPWEAAYERTVVAGTHGYLAPEFVYRNELTTKSDVYSFGVVMLELISGRKPAMPVDVVDWQSIFEWATPLVQSQQLLEIIDPSLTSVPVVSQIQKLVDLIYSCTQHVPSMRPRMSYVVHQLQQIDLDAVQEARNNQDHEFLPQNRQQSPQQQQQLLQEMYRPSDVLANEPALISVQSEIMESLF